MKDQRQSVNFSRRSPPRYRLPALFSLAWNTAAALLFASLLGAVSAHDAYRQRQQTNALATAAKATARQLDALAELRRRYPEPKPDPLLAAEAERRARQLDNWRGLLDRLETTKPASRAGFSRYFEALARRMPPDAWLTGIHLEAQGEEIELAGSALAAEQVPALIEALGGEPAFNSRSFAELDMRRPDDPAERIDFVLRTTPKTAALHVEP